MALLDDLRQRRADARTAADAILTRAAADAILTRAAEEQRDLTPEEATTHHAQVVAEREAADALEAEHDRELAELRAAATRRPAGPAVPRGRS